MATVSYGMKIKNENHIFDKTIEVYRDAVKYLTNIVLLHYRRAENRGQRQLLVGIKVAGRVRGSLETPPASGSSEPCSRNHDTISGIQGYGGATAQQCRRQYVEMLVHTTEKNDAVYKKFDEDFYKFPSYLRRDAITTAIGNVMSYKSLVENLEANGKQGRKPFLNMNQDTMPCFYRGNTFNQDGTNVEIKLYDGHDWVWHSMQIRNTDFQYALTKAQETPGQRMLSAGNNKSASSVSPNPRPKSGAKRIARRIKKCQ